MPLTIKDKKTGKPVVTLEDDGELRVDKPADNKTEEDEEQNAEDQTSESN